MSNDQLQSALAGLKTLETLAPIGASFTLVVKESTKDGLSARYGIFDLTVGGGARFTRDTSVEPALGFRASAGLRFGSPGFGGSVSADVLRILELLRTAKGDQDWIFGGGLRLHWGGDSSAPR